MADNNGLLFTASQESGTLGEWHTTSVSGAGSSIRAVSAASQGIPAVDGSYVVKATLSGSGAGYARTHFQHKDADVPTWGEGTDVWYSGDFYLPKGFYAAKSSSNDIMRWDAYVNGSSDIQGGLGITSGDTLRIMANYPYTQPLATSYKIPEATWTHIEVHQKISQTSGKALNEIYVDGALIGSSTTANYKGTAYSSGEQAINRLRVGLVSEGDVNDTNSLYFDNVNISTTRSTTGGSGTPLPETVPPLPAGGAINGTSASDTLSGKGGNDQLFGLDGNDQLFGFDGNDTLSGGRGSDSLTGGSGADVFVFESFRDSTPSARDTIQDFVSGIDKINLSAVDAANGISGQQHFSFIGSSAFTGKAGQLRYANGTLSGDLNGDTGSEFLLKIAGAPTLQAGDFYL